MPLLYCIVQRIFPEINRSKQRLLEDDYAVRGPELVLFLLVSFGLVQPFFFVDKVFEFVLAFLRKGNLRRERTIFLFAHGHQGFPIAVQTGNRYGFCILRLQSELHFAVIFGLEVCFLDHLMDSFASVYKLKKKVTLLLHNLSHCQFALIWKRITISSGYGAGFKHETRQTASFSPCYFV